MRLELYNEEVITQTFVKGNCQQLSIYFDKYFVSQISKWKCKLFNYFHNKYKESMQDDGLQGKKVKRKPNNIFKGLGCLNPKQNL